MRKRLKSEDKRSEIIGIKVKPETKEQLQWIADREAQKVSTYIDQILTEHIETYFRHAHINWNKEKRNTKRNEFI